MADYLYGKGRQRFLGNSGDQINWTSDNIKVMLVDGASYTPAQDTDEYQSAVPSGMRVATSGNLASKSVTLGVADAADVTFTSVSGAQSEYLVSVKDTGGADTTNPLIFKIDSYTGLPVTPNGANITIQWPSDSNKIFRL